MASKTEQRKIEIIADAKKADASIKDMRAGVALLNNQLNKLPQGTQAFADKAKELNEVKKRLNDVKNEANQIGPAMEKGNMGTKLLAGGTNMLKGAFQAAVAALLPLFAFQKLVELARHFFNVSEEVNKLKGNVQTLTGATGAELDTITAQVQALGNTFEKDYNEVLKAGNVLAKQMGISHEEAFGIIEKGLLAGADINGDFLEQISEYAPQFKAAGIEAEDFVAQLVRAESEGIFSDKGADVIKEFGLRIREQTKASKDALESAFGTDFTQSLFDGINDGSITTVEALKRVSREMSESGATASELQTVVADVFGGPGEDVGMEYLMNLQNIGGELESMIDLTNHVTRRKIDQLAVERELAAAQVELGVELGPVTTGFSNFADILQTYVIRGIVAVLRHLQSVRSMAIGVVMSVKELANNFATLFSALVSGDFSAIKEAFTNLGSGVSEAYQEGYMFSESLYERDRLEAKKEQAAKEAAVDKEGLAQQAIARDQAHAAEQRKLQEHAQKLAEERKKAKEAEIAAERALEDLRVEMIADSNERELAALQLKHQRELEQLEGTEQQKEEMKRLLREQFRMEREEILAEQEEERKEKEEEAFEAELEQMEIKEEERRLILEGQFLQGLTTQQERDAALLDLQRSMLEAKLALLQEAGMGESTQALQLKNQILAIEKEKNAKIVEDAKEREAMLKQIRDEGIGVAFESMNILVGFAQQEADEKAASIDRQIEAIKAQGDNEEVNAQRIAMLEEEKGRILKEAAKKRQKLEIARTIADGIREVAQLWAGYASMGPVGVVLAGVQTAFAAARTALAVRNLRSQQYAKGGFTSALSVNGAGKLIDDTGYAVAGVAHEGEWYAPKWMVETPQYANVIGWLESERTRKFADGGYTAPSSPSSSAAPGVDVAAMQQNMVMLTDKFDRYAAKVDQWARELKVFNDVRDTRSALQAINRIDEQSSIR